MMMWIYIGGAPPFPADTMGERAVFGRIQPNPDYAMSSWFIPSSFNSAPECDKYLQTSGMKMAEWNSRAVREPAAGFQSCAVSRGFCAERQQDPEQARINARAPRGEPWGARACGRRGRSGWNYSAATASAEVTEPNRWPASPVLRVKLSTTGSSLASSSSAWIFSEAERRAAADFMVSITALLASVACRASLRGSRKL